MADARDVDEGGLLNEAQDLIYEAWETDDPDEQIALAQQALELSKDCADAYSLLAEAPDVTVEDAARLYGQGMEAARRALGEEQFKAMAGEFWLWFETRPYMRARCGLAECLWALGCRDEAVSHLQAMLKLNPGDNQGIRYPLLAQLVELDRDAEAEALLGEYEDEPTAVWLYMRALVTFRSDGDSPLARQMLDEALRANPYVILYFMGTLPMPSPLPDSYAIGEQSEAVVCAVHCGQIWLKTPGALDWLSAQTE